MKQNYAGFWQRFLALLIDVIILGVASGIISYVLRMVTSSQGNLLDTLVQIALAVGYWVFYQQAYGQTIGKKALGIKVVDATGKTPAVMTFFLREIIGKFISGLTLGIGYLWMIWDGKKQTVHDHVAGTYVIKV